MTGWSDARQLDIFKKALACLDWYKAQGQSAPDAFMAMWADMVVAEDQTLTPQRLERARQLARERGWIASGE